MSPRAAARLEILGYEQVYDYAPGKADWLARGLPVEGKEADAVRAGDLVHHDLPTCRIDESLSEAEARLETSDWDVCVVSNTDGLVLGLLHQAEIETGRSGTIEEVMEEGPTTFRPDSSPDALRDYLSRSNRELALVTSNRGKLIGAVTKADLSSVAGATVQDA